MVILGFALTTTKSTHHKETWQKTVFKNFTTRSHTIIEISSKIELGFTEMVNEVLNTFFSRFWSTAGTVFRKYFSIICNQKSEQGVKIVVQKH